MWPKIASYAKAPIGTYPDSSVIYVYIQACAHACALLYVCTVYSGKDIDNKISSRKKATKIYMQMCSSEHVRSCGQLVYNK